MQNINSKKLKYFRKVITFIDNDEIDKAKAYLNNLPQVPYKKFFYNRIEEKKLPLDIKERFLDTGRYALELHEYESATDYFEAGKYVSNNPIFDYYLGKTYYKCNYLETSLFYLNNYRFTGSLKLNKCYFYIFLISKMLEFKNTKRYIDKCRDINKFLSIEFKSRNPNKKKKKPTKKNIPYEDLAFKEQLEYIKKLLLQRKEKEANKLLRNIKTTSKNEREKVLQLEKNKKLYLNKAK